MAGQAKDIFLSPEARFAGCTAVVPSKPPLPWNPELVKASYVDGLGPFEHPPDSTEEWHNSGKLLETGRRRYSAYPTYGNRDGPQLAYGLHPSRSSLRPLVSSYVRTPAAHTLECMPGGILPPPQIGNAADSLECGKHGQQLVLQGDGSIRSAKGKPPPAGRPFSGYQAVVPFASAALEGNIMWTQPRRNPQVRIGGLIKPKGDEMLMDDIVAEFNRTPLSNSSDSDSD